MRYIWQHIKAILESYTGELPLAHFLKNYYKQHPILGSRDRKLLSAVAYSWYRCAKGVSVTGDLEEKIKACLLICNNELPRALQSADDAIGVSDIPFDLNSLFPSANELSSGITKDDWLRSMLTQPNLFIRVLKDKGKLISLLNGQKIPFTFINDNCLSLPNGAKVDTLLPADAYVVQDASSQETGTFFQPKKNEYWYDCCAGAGGKSLLLKDIEPGVRITVSDKRETVIYNLKQRFKTYNYHEPIAHITDVTNREQLAKSLGSKQFDNIICDAPCSGSGTWARTPEQLYFFDPETIQKFSVLQKQIAVNVASYLRTGGHLIYITCSVFKQENENVVSSIISETGLQLQQSQLINGFNKHADSMYIAVLEKIG